MFPLIINTIPENGAENVELTTAIEITLSEEINPSSSYLNTNNVQLINNNTGDDVTGYTVEAQGGNTKVVIILGSPLNPLTEYRVLLSGLVSTYGETMTGTYELRFVTEEGAIGDYVEDPNDYSFFEVTRTYPKEDSVKTPSVIKVKFSDVIDASTDKTGIMLIDDNSITNVEDAIFMGENLITPTDINIVEDVIEINPSIELFENGKEYSVVIDKVTNIEGSAVVPHFYSFYSEYTPSYCNVGSVLTMKAVAMLTKDSNDVDIARAIHDNSKMAEFIASEHDTTDDINWIEPDIYLEKYVQTKTQYDVLFDKFLEISSTPTSKQLDNLTIEYGMSLSDLLKLTDKLKLEYEKWEDYLKGVRNRGKARAGTFVKGESIDESPEFMERKLRDREGNKEW